MPLKLHNTRTRRVEFFEPLRGRDVRIYVCGLTPSAQAHLGHARSFLFFDVLRRYLEHLGYAVTYVQNVTDIDDRSINRARETGEDWHTIVKGYYADFKAAMVRLGVREPDLEPHATDYIPQIQTMIVALVAGGHAYVTADGIYYRVSTFADYGHLSGRNVDELQAGARIEIDERKDDPLDFALWKFAKPGEPKWTFEGFGDGRPGWHIECSAMSHALLDPEGVGFDIHGGGADLIFPHHENEIAQSEPLMKHPPMANVWVHGGLLLFDNRKMSKSLGNFEPLSDVLDRYDAQAVRLLFLRTGYSKVMNFTDDAMASAIAELERLKKAYRVLHQGATSITTDLRATGLIQRIERALDEDMNLAVVLAELLGFANSFEIHAARVGRDATLYEFSYALALVGIAPNAAWLGVPAVLMPADMADRLRAQLGDAIALDARTPEDAVAAVIDARNRARAEKDWAKSDRLRDALLHCGIVLKDAKGETTWTLAG
ncbi:MAG: cysteine--tRNA ligase [Vulcanimicrobiaceae bacterium]